MADTALSIDLCHKLLDFSFLYKPSTKKQRSPMADTALSIDLCHKLLDFSFLYKPSTKKSKEVQT